MADKDDAKVKLDFEACVISSTETDSNAVDLRGTTLCGVYLPSDFTGTEVTFKAAISETDTFVDVEDGGRCCCVYNCFT